MSANERRLLEMEREVVRAAGLAVARNILFSDEMQRRLPLYTTPDPDEAEALGQAWIARITGLDEKKWIHMGPLTNGHRAV